MKYWKWLLCCFPSGIASFLWQRRDKWRRIRGQRPQPRTRERTGFDDWSQVFERKDVTEVDSASKHQELEIK
jgi:hypothetical protein